MSLLLHAYVLCVSYCVHKQIAHNTVVVDVMQNWFMFLLLITIRRQKSYSCGKWYNCSFRGLVNKHFKVCGNYWHSNTTTYSCVIVVIVATQQ